VLRREGVSATVVNCRFMKLYDREALSDVLGRHDAVLTVEEGSVVNGFGAFLAREILDDPALPFPARFGTLGIPDRFISHGPRNVLLREIDLDAPGIAGRVRTLLGRGVLDSGVRISRETA